MYQPLLSERKELIGGRSTLLLRVRSKRIFGERQPSEGILLALKACGSRRHEAAGGLLDTDTTNPQFMQVWKLHEQTAQIMHREGPVSESLTAHTATACAGADEPLCNSIQKGIDRLLNLASLCCAGTICAGHADHRKDRDVLLEGRLAHCGIPKPIPALSQECKIYAAGEA